MYSRKFNGIHSLPPDYSGVALRKEAIKEQEEKPPHEKEAQDINDGYQTYPKYPVCLENPNESSCNKQKEQSPDSKEKKKSGMLSSLATKSFSLEDIILAGLILLILNEEKRDDELLLILGFLLLIGLK